MRLFDDYLEWQNADLECSLGSGVKTVVVASVRVYRETLAAELHRTRQVEVLGTARNWSEALTHVQAAQPEVLLADVGLTSNGGIRLAEQIAPDARIVALGVAEDERAVLACLEDGASAYVHSHASLAELVDTIAHAASGQLLCSPRVAAALGRRVADLTAQSVPASRAARLTARELEVLQLIERRMTNQDIASRLCIEVTTVKNHVHSILAKLEVGRRDEAADWIRGRAG